MTSLNIWEEFIEEKKDGNKKDQLATFDTDFPYRVNPLAQQYRKKKEHNVHIKSSETKNICPKCFKTIYCPQKEHEVNHMIEIIPFVYLGTAENTYYIEELMSFKISSIVNCAYEIKYMFYDAPISFNHFKWDDREDFDILQDLDQVADIINETIDDSIEKKSNVLVHCQFGISRSVSAIIAYLIKYQGKTYKEALDMIKLKKESVNPNNGFKQQLEQYYEICSERNENKEEELTCFHF